MPQKFKSHVGGMEIYRSFTRPAIYDSIKSVLGFFNIQGVKNIYYRGEAEVVKLAGSDYTEPASDSLYTDGTFRNKIYVNATIDPSPFNSGYHNQRRMDTEAYFWQDKDNNIALTPIFEGRQVTVEVMGHFNNRIDAQNYVNAINYTRSQLINDFTFDPTGHLPVNDGILELINEVQGLLVKNGKRTDTFQDYLIEKSLRPFTILSNLGGKNRTLAYPIKIRNVTIQFEDGDVRIPQKAEIFGQYEASFTYTFFHNEFIGWDIYYPLNICQDEINNKWIPKVREIFNENNLPYELANPEYYCGVRFTDNERKTQSPFHLVIPNYDNWVKPQYADLTPVIQAIIKVENTPGEQLLCNLFTDFPNFNWTDAAKNYILRRCDYAFQVGFTPFPLQVYSDDLLVNADQCRLDSTGNVYITRPPTMFRAQHLIVNLDQDIAGLGFDFWDDIKDNPGDAPLIPGVYPWLPWDSLPDDWYDNAPDNLPLDTKRVWNNYEMALGLIVDNIKNLTQGQ